MGFAVAVLLAVIVGVTVDAALYFPLFHRTHPDVALVIGVLAGVVASLGVLTRSRTR